MAGTVYALPAPAALEADDAAELAAEAKLPAALEALVTSEDAAEVALAMTLLSAELALAIMLLMRLERLLRSAPVAVAATDDRLETSEPAEAVMDETWESTEESTEVTPEGTLEA